MTAPEVGDAAPPAAPTTTLSTGAPATTTTTPSNEMGNEMGNERAIEKPGNEKALAEKPGGPAGGGPPGGGENDAMPAGDKRMTIWEHLDELRSRIIKAALGVLAATVAGWCFRTQILAWIVVPYQRIWMTRFHKELVLQTLAPADAFLGYFELSLMAGVVAAAPIIFYQLWAFISPGLYGKEKRLIIPFVLFSSILFLSGVAFAYYVAFPFTFNYFLSLLGEVKEGVELTQIVTLEQFLDFATRFLLAFGAVFELPLFIAFLVLANVVTPKQLLKFGRWATILAFVLGAVVTPGPEVTSQIAVSAALIGLYFLSIPLAYLLKPRPAKA